MKDTQSLWKAAPVAAGLGTLTEFFHLPVCRARVGDPEANLLNSTSHKGVILVHRWVHDQIYLWEEDGVSQRAGQV